MDCFQFRRESEKSKNTRRSKRSTLNPSLMSTKKYTNSSEATSSTRNNNVDITKNNEKPENAIAFEQSTESHNARSSSSNIQPVADTQVPIEDPSNSPEVNAKRRQELEAVRKLNSAVQTINSNLEHSKANLQVNYSIYRFAFVNHHVEHFLFCFR